ncbi:MAG: hypothetical protein B6244_00340 [Candidatus Cloacimonetes bacterium 4572_55]|nr:MAG: hypothetical protein B6244_00340 [Candidatus Cloacimonetes bacterium 4572_55]
MRKFTLLLLTLSLLIWTVGCDDSPTDTPMPGSSDEEEIFQVLETETDLLPSEFRDNEINGEAIPSGMSDGEIQEEITPMRFGRQVLNRSFHRELELTSDTTATVTLTYGMSGIFHLIGVAEGDTVPVHYEKDFSDEAVRFVYLRKRAPRPSSERRWVLVAVSGTLIETEGGSIEIESINFQSASLDTTITDVLGIINRENIPTFAIGDDVTVTVRTNNLDDDVVAHFRPRHRFRVRLEPQGDGSYTLAWQPRLRGVHHVAFSVLTHGTLHDSEAPYDNMGWGLSYRVVQD